MPPVIERITVTLPDGFDPRKHTAALLRRIAEARGDGWEIDSIDPAARTATASRQAEVTEVQAATPDSFAVHLARGTKPADGERIATKLEAQYPGHLMTVFEPYLAQATLTRLDEATVRARGAVAVALGVKPWDVQVRPQPGGGYDLNLPRTYVPSRHDAKLTEVAETVVGREGWYVTTDPARLTARIVPAEPPTFPAAIPYPFGRAATPARDLGEGLQVPIGLTLARTPQELILDLDATPGILLAGTAGAGKSAAVAALIFGVLARGAELVIGDVPHKAVDFTWVKPFVRPGGFGCASTAATLTALSMVFEEGQRRADLLAEHDAQKWQDLPPAVRPPLIVVVLDEVTGLFALEDVPKGLPKDHPLVVEAQQKNLEVQMLKKVVARLPAEMRFAGIRIVLATQMAQANTGISVPLKTNLANRALLGANPNDAARSHAFLDPRAAPKVPDYLRADPAASRGVGVAEFEGREPAVFKSYFATTAQYAQHIAALGCPTTAQPEPSAAQIARHTPSLREDRDERPTTRLDREGGFGHQEGAEPRLRGAAAASHQLAVDAATARARAARETTRTVGDR